MSGNEPKIIHNMVSVTPKELYLQRVKATYDALRQSRQGRDYVPPSFGGLFGQQTLVDNPNVLEIINFESQ